MRHGELWWATLAGPAGSGPGFRRPVVVLQADEFNQSRIATVVVAAVTSNLRLAAAPGNVLCRRRQSGLRRDSVINVSQLLTVDKLYLTERVRELPAEVVTAMRVGLRLVLGL